METRRQLVGKARQFKVVCGDDARDTPLGNVFEEEPRPSEFVGRICAFQYLVEYYQRVTMGIAEIDETLQAQQLGIEIAYAARRLSCACS